MATSYKYYFDNEMLSNDLMKHFSFLINKFDFVKLPEYQYVREVHNDFVGKEILIKLNYEGSFLLEILKPKFDINELINGRKRTVDYKYSDFNRYDLRNLDLNHKIYNSISSDNFPDKDLWYYSKLLQENEEILEGKMTKLQWTYRILKRLGIK